MDRIPISKQGFEKIKQELEDLKAQRPAIIQAIKEAREEGDLSENAGYDAARERQGMLEARITYINSRMPLFDVLDLDTLNGERAIFGATVEVEDLDTEETRRFLLLGPDDADHKNGSISVLSPWVKHCWARKRATRSLSTLRAARSNTKLSLSSSLGLPDSKSD